MHAITAVQVRRDLMLIGFCSDSKKGYDIKVLVDFIGSILDSECRMNVAIIGMGNLGQAVTMYFKGQRSKLKIVASFDNDPRKIGQEIASVPCYDANDFAEKVAELGIRIVILSLPSKFAHDFNDAIRNSGIRGVLNFTSTPLNLPENIYVEDYDIITLLEKVAYFSK